MTKIKGLLQNVPETEVLSYSRFKKFAKEALDFYGVEATIVPVDASFYEQGAVGAATKINGSYYILYLARTMNVQAHKLMNVSDTAWHEATHVALWDLDEDIREDIVNSIYEISKLKFECHKIKNADYLIESIINGNKEEVVCEMASSKDVKTLSKRIVRFLINKGKKLTIEEKQVLKENL